MSELIGLLFFLWWFVALVVLPIIEYADKQGSK